MQQHSLQRRTFHYLPPGGSSVSSDRLENVAFRLPELSAIHLEERCAHRDLDLARHLRESWLPERQTPPRRRICVFPRGAATALARIFVVRKVGQAAI